MFNICNDDIPILAEHNGLKQIRNHVIG